MNNPMKMMTVNDTIELQFMNSQHYDVIGSAKNQKEAIDLFTELQPDLVTMDFSDVDMIEKGHESLCCIDKILAKKPDTKILVLCSLKNQSIGIKALMHGAHSFLQKPFNQDQLSRALKTTSAKLVL